MQINGLIQGTLIKRYKRFLADITLESGEEVTVHCPNTGSMKNCADPGSRVWVLDSQNPKRKYPLGWEIVEVEGRYMACVNTGRANKLVKEAIENGVVSSLQGYASLRQEVKYGENSRIDLLLEDEKKGRAWVEVKNVTLLEEDNWGSFPDAVTARGAKHLRELMAMVEQGDRAVMLFCVPHTGIKKVRPADHVDPEYGRLLREAKRVGVEVIAYGADIDEHHVTLARELPVEL
ncbi:MULTISPECIES: DNA/RNA nuclease SfsA [unclassified Neptuniibacter]|uniref:DNA/RNA nuclease SfsA n=1 Tax=unclassified Neptuniibacter TaxID=2630693 RepID=UPI000C424138|nr:MULTISPECIES: DNA/RNA nuclease SfsA [unclassified Neptuniibacter]MAY43599.1 DNA/RNA nuclease SfsA [Oceanospirillaceae bacterium]|tara:strand:+ start:6237 stop:6938 length:702 start_codon:yes stop_codon:yes gene_type:complete